ncbi:hypothetical protein [Cryobacterium sp. N19]|uniref:glycosyltransferase family 2 protein n=1 Tax=Cryobacterium sp. N19 TaxID=2048288 RepID=UPI001304CC07|nr:hypothetical protein [Cryobacterium sp. N19]
MKCIMTFTAGIDPVLFSEMIEFHLAQGVDAFIVADTTRSSDVTRILAGYARQGIVHVPDNREYSSHDTNLDERLARQALTSHGATCVLSGQSGDFWLAEDRSLTLRQVLESIQPPYRIPLVPVSSRLVDPPDARIDRYVRWNSSASIDHDGMSGDPLPVEVLRRPLVVETETEFLRTLHGIRESRLLRFVDLANEVESLRSEMQMMRARKVVRVSDRAVLVVKRANAQKAIAIAATTAAPAKILDWWRGKQRRLRDLRANSERAREVRRLLNEGLPLAVANGSHDSSALPVVMCLWNRPQRLGTMLESLSRQSTSRSLRVILWNNAPRDADYYGAQVHLAARYGALASIELLSNSINIGGMARFVVARTLWEQGIRGPFIMVDDDQDLNETFIEDTLAGYEPHSINSWWAFRNHGSHWNRSQLAAGDPADYCGTGGAAVDLDIVEDRNFFDIPVRYFMLEDQWMSHYARTRGWIIRKSSAHITAVLEETNQYHALRDLKDEFFVFLNRDLG